MTDVGPELAAIEAMDLAALRRAWRGRTYLVTVTDDGVVYDGVTYRSLSAVAHQITGAHWSGPRFFGLRPAAPRPGAAAHG